MKPNGKEYFTPRRRRGAEKRSRKNNE